MALKNLRTGEMLSLSGPLVDAQHAEHLALAADPLTAGLLPYVSKAHQRLLETQVRDKLEQRISAIANEQARHDLLHDDLLRAIHDILGALARTTRDEAAAKRYLELRSTILPDGLVALNRSYREEAGQAALLAARLTAEHRSLLESLHIGERSAWALMEEFFEVAAQLGRLQDEREAAERSSPSPADVVAARNLWIRTMNVLLPAIALMDAPSSTLQTIPRRFAEADKRIRQRVRPETGVEPELAQPQTPELVDPETP